jgi:hypothetical protein
MAKDMQLEYIERSFDENAKVTGNLGRLDEKRLVFIGSRKDVEGTWYVGFRNSEGEDTKILLSHEAMAMLVQLYKKHPKGEDVWPLQIKTAWQVTLKNKDDATPAPEE